MDARVILGAVDQAVVYRVLLIAGGVSGVLIANIFLSEAYMNFRRGMLAMVEGEKRRGYLGVAAVKLSGGKRPLGAYKSRRRARAQFPSKI